MEFLYQLLTYMFTYARNEYRQVREDSEATYQTPSRRLSSLDRLVLRLRVTSRCSRVSRRS